MPVGFVLVLLSFSFWVGSLESRLSKTEENAALVRDRVISQLDNQRDQTQRMSAHLSGIDAKLSAFIDFYRERAIPPRK